MPNVYYDPDKLNLAPIAEIDLREPDYSFDILSVWKHTETGKVYYAFDSGCSCPVPFEDYNSVESLTELTDVQALKDFIKQDTYTDADPLKLATFYGEVSKALAKFE